MATDFTLAFNRGVISPLARNRADVKRVGVSAETQMNWMPRAMGPMSLRPGFEYIADVTNAYGAIKLIPFVFSNTDKALVVVTDEFMAVLVDDLPITRASHSTTIANEGFDSDLASWTDDDEGTAASTWSTGYMSLEGTGNERAIRYQAVSVSSGDVGVEHAVRIILDEGVAGFKIGTTTDLDDVFRTTYLKAGTHSIAFTPGATTIYITFFNLDLEIALVNSCAIEAAGDMTFTTNLLPSENLDAVRHVQSGDIIFAARGGQNPPMQIERRSTTSWSLVLYRADDGPFRAQNFSNVTLSSAELTGVTTITASQPIFNSGNIGSLYTLTSSGQTRNSTLGSLDSVTDSIKVTGITDSRIFDIDIAGTFTGTIDLEQSVEHEGNWFVVASYTAVQDITYDDGLDNQIVYYRLKMSAYTSGSADATLHIRSGSVTGTVRLTVFTDSANMDGIVLAPMGDTNPTKDWAEGAWSLRRGFPSAVDFHLARLYWAGKDKLWGSVVDDFYSFDPNYIGDAGPVGRSIGTGPVDEINWLMSVRNLLVGAQGAEFVARSTEFEEAITPSNFNIRSETTYGSGGVSPVKIDRTAVFLDRTETRLMETEDSQQGTNTVDLSMLTPEILLPRAVRVAVQRRPDTRVHIVRCDGTAVVLVTDRTEEVRAFITVETEGLIEDVAVLPNTPEDDVYYVVTRMVEGSPVRYLEKWAKETETLGAERTKLADSFVIYSGTSTTTITGLDHLEGKSVVAWGNTKDLGTYTVSGGSITLSEAVTWACVGLSYYAYYVSGKLELLTQGAPSLAAAKRVSQARILLKDAHENGLEFGSDPDYLDALPPVEDEATVASDYIWSSYDTDPLIFNSDHSYDQRLILKATAPRACTVLAAIIDTEDK